MKQWVIIISLLFTGLLVGCASQQDLQALRADVVALESQRTPREQGFEQRLQTLSDQLARFEQSQTEVRRELAQAKAAAEELRVETQRLRGEMQETRQRMRRGLEQTPEARDIFATKLAELQTRLGNLESRLEGGAAHAPAKPPAPTPEPAKPSGVAAEPAKPSPPAPPSQPAPATTKPTSPPTPATKPPTAPQPTQTANVPAGGDEAERLYKRALQEQQQGNHEVAIVLFKQFLRQHPKASMAGTAQYGIGESLYAQKQFEAAIVAFDEVIRKYPNDSRIPAALLKQGYAFAELKDVRNARFFLQQVQQKYPDSPEARQATEKLKQLQRQG
jgi:tol-pal system protein YbgF